MKKRRQLRIKTKEREKSVYREKGRRERKSIKKKREKGIRVVKIDYKKGIWEMYDFLCVVLLITPPPKLVPILSPVYID